MKIAALHHTSSYRGDHTADICVVVDLVPGETVEQLAERVLTANRRDEPFDNAYSDSIEIKLVLPWKEAP